MRTSPALGSGSAPSQTSRPSGPPFRLIHTCRLAAPLRSAPPACEHEQVRTSRAVATAGFTALIACATARPPSAAPDVPRAVQVEGPGLLFELLYTSADEPQISRIRSGLLAVGPRLSRWGSFRQGVWIRVFPDHDSLEEAGDRR